mgnify:CR=1 FL=1
MSSGWKQDHPPISPYQAYLEESHSPIVSLIFTLPLFLAYHFGIWAIQKLEDAPWANGADRLLATILTKFGVSGPLLSLCFVVTVLLIWQQASGRPWRVRGITLFIMLLECSFFALPPFLLGKVVRHILMSAGSGGALPVHINLVLSLGAGVYEEFFFRMLLLSLLLFLFGTVFRMEGFRLYFTAVLVQAFLFALFHHLPGSPEPLNLLSKEFWQAFAFRTLAGVYFAHLYHERGFGIAAGSHAAYDVIAVTMNAFR